MINKFLYGIAIGAVLLSSCSSEEPMNGTGDGNVTFTAVLPDGINTRSAYDNGTVATALTCAVYDADGTNISGLTQTKTLENKATTVNFNLVTGKTYTVVFWAQAPGADAPYTFDTTTGKVTVNTDADGKVTGAANDVNRDAFFAYETFTVTGAINKPVTLKRPFAQINIGTNDKTDFTNAGGSISKSGMTVAGVPNVLNLLDGTVDGSVEYVYTPADLVSVTETEAFPAGATYEWLAANYILVGDSKETVNITWTSDNASNPAQEYTFIPVQRNYRTNVYGSLLTNPAVYNVEIDSDFETPDYGKSFWDGKTVTYPAVNETTKTVEIKEASDLIGLANLVNGIADTRAESAQPKDFAGYTITLTQDYDLAGFEFPQIGAGAVRSGTNTVGNAFRGVLDGNGHTIKNLKLSYDGTNGDMTLGFITVLDGANAALKNLTFENVQINSVAEQAGIVSLLTNNATVENVKVLSGNVKAMQAAGGIVGRMIIEGSISNCYNAANIEVETGNAGGIAGAAYYSRIGKEMFITDCTNEGNIKAGNTSAGGITGISAANITRCTNKGDVWAFRNSAGGVVGYHMTVGYVRDCVNYGNITVSDGGRSIGAGGIVGWVTLMINPTAYERMEQVEVTGCTNYGAIQSYNSAGGIVGKWYYGGLCENNVNYSTSISATNEFVGSIIGDSQWVAPNDYFNYFPDSKLTVRGNKTAATLDDLKGGCKDLFVYINSAQYVVSENNTTIGDIDEGDSEDPFN